MNPPSNLASRLFGVVLLLLVLFNVILWRDKVGVEAMISMMILQVVLGLRLLIRGTIH